MTRLSAALSRVIASARSLTSVATIVAGVLGQVQGLHAAAGAEVEGPARPGSRTVSWASDDEAELIPRTWSAVTPMGAPSRPGVRSLTTHQSRPSSA